MKRRTRHIDMPIDALELIASRFRVMAEPVRLRILQALEANMKTLGGIIVLLGLIASDARADGDGVA